MRKSTQKISNSRVGGHVTQTTQADEAQQGVRDVDVIGNIVQLAGQHTSPQGGDRKKPYPDEPHQPNAWLSGLSALSASGSTLAKQPANAFLSYAPADEALARAFEAHLAGLQRDNLLTTWHEGLVTPGSAWDETTCQWLDKAVLILLLVSADFLASDRCYNVHLSRALRRHEAGQARVIPILLRPCDWSTTDLSVFEPLPKNRKPVTVSLNWDSAFAAIASDLRQSLELLAQRDSAHK